MLYQRKEVVQKIRQLLAAGWSKKAIAREVGCSVESVARVIASVSK